jgi:hypothetical protein
VADAHGPAEHHHARRPPSAPRAWTSLFRLLTFTPASAAAQVTTLCWLVAGWIVVEQPRCGFGCVISAQGWDPLVSTARVFCLCLVWWYCDKSVSCWCTRLRSFTLRRSWRCLVIQQLSCCFFIILGLFRGLTFQELPIEVADLFVNSYPFLNKW